MRRTWQASVAIALTVAVLRAAPPAGRPDLATSKPIVACKLQALAEKPRPMAEPPAVVMYGRPPVEDPLTNYQRTSLGDWPMLADAERSDPWLRVVLLSRKRPVVVDLAILIGGKSFREKREAWSDELVASTKPGVKRAAVDPPAAKETAEKPGNNKAESDGTKPAAAASEASTSKAVAVKDEKGKAKTAEKSEADNNSDKSDKGKKAKIDPNAVPGIAVESRHAPTMRERLADYLATNSSRIDRDEIRWLIAAWGAGPGVVMLDPSISWQRSELAPLETYLDRNGDGNYSRDEISQAEAMLKRADVDSNDVVDVSEIRRVIDHAEPAPAASGYPLIVALDANTDWPSLESTMLQIYGMRPENSQSSLQSRPADVTLQVTLGTSDTGASGVSVLGLGPDFSGSTSAVSATADVATLDLGADYVEFSAAQGAAAQESDSGAAQIAIGAVFDGNPLVRLLDRDNDGRLTRRERQELSGLFASLDRDGNGEVSASEMPVPIRFAVTLGPHVHELLASPRPAARAMTPRSETAKAPTWFASMDKNNDGDLSRSEFLGTTEQFKKLDTNGDGLLSIAEALKFDAEK